MPLIGRSIVELSDLCLHTYRQQPKVVDENGSNKTSCSSEVAMLQSENKELSVRQDKNSNSRRPSLLLTAVKQHQQDKEEKGQQKKQQQQQQQQLQDISKKRRFNDSGSNRKNDTNNNKNTNPSEPNRILLQGPRSSGRSSILMDYAISIASSGNVPCRNRECQLSESSCRCVSVTIFVSQDSHDDNILFPLPCHRHDNNNNKTNNKIGHDHDHNSNILAQNVQLAHTSTQQQHGERLSWNIDALRRIRIYHITSARDCLEYLLSVQAKPIHEQPWGAILIDDVDILARDHPRSRMQQQQFPPCPQPTNITVNYFIVNQILAILLDTANAMKNIHGSSVCHPFVLATVRDTLPTKVEYFLENLFPIVINLSEKSSSSNMAACTTNHHLNSWKSVLDESGDEVIVTCWKVHVRTKGYNTNKDKYHTSNACGNHRKEDPNNMLEYAITRSPTNGFRIVWK